jgi:hypothetical protein
MIIMGTHANGAVVCYLRDGHFGHPGCTASAQVQVSVQLSGVTDTVIESAEAWTCEMCGLSDPERQRVRHLSLADALTRLPPPPPGEKDVDELAAEMLSDIALIRAADARSA